MENIELNENNIDDEIQVIKGDEIDLIALMKTIWNSRKTVIYTTTIVVVLGFMIAIFSPVKWGSEAVLLLQQEENSMPNLGGLGALAGMAGINIGSFMSSSGITTDLYQDIIYSYPFMSELLNCSFYFQKEGRNVKLYDKLYADTIPSFGERLVKYTIRLPWTIKQKTLKQNKSHIGLEIDETDNENTKLIVMDFDLNRILESTSEIIKIAIDKETGLITVGAILKREPIATTQITNKMVDLLQKYIIDNQTKQVQENLQFIEVMYFEKKNEYENNRKALFEYQDAHRNMVLERSDIYFQELKDTYNLSMNIFQSLAEQYEQAKIAVRKQTPVFTIIEPAKVPFEKKSPKRTKIVILSGFLGVFLGIGVVFCKGFFDKIKNAW